MLWCSREDYWINEEIWVLILTWPLSAFEVLGNCFFFCVCTVNSSDTHFSYWDEV